MDSPPSRLEPTRTPRSCSLPRHPRLLQPVVDLPVAAVAAVAVAVEVAVAAAGVAVVAEDEEEDVGGGLKDEEGHSKKLRFTWNS